MPSCRELLEEKAQQWQRVVQPRFLQSCKDGSLSRQQFSTWLGEDFKFVQQFARFAGSLLSKAEAAGDLEVLAGGVGALADELRWFKASAPCAPRGGATLLSVSAYFKTPALTSGSRPLIAGCCSGAGSGAGRPTPPRLRALHPIPAQLRRAAVCSPGSGLLGH